MLPQLRKECIVRKLLPQRSRSFWLRALALGCQPSLSAPCLSFWLLASVMHALEVGIACMLIKIPIKDTKTFVAQTQGVPNEFSTPYAAFARDD
ncbi:MAG: hypothetical protein EBX17_00295, partial [Betaproteobacteria bacterium]|nr:hypothetical protein [Betaproteobacteria bacterium]